MSEFDAALVFPSSGIHPWSGGDLDGLYLGLRPTPSHRVFGPGSPEAWHSWFGAPFAVPLFSQHEMSLLAGEDRLPEAWRDPDAKVCWSRPWAASHPLGSRWFVGQFETTGFGRLVIDAWGRKGVDVWVDGVPVILTDDAVDETGWRNAQRAEIEANNGTHHIAVKVSNRGGWGGALCSVFYADGNTPVWRIQQAIAWDHPTPAPTFTHGGMAILLMLEALARGPVNAPRRTLEGWSVSFTADEDSNGRPWPAVPTFAVPIGSTLREVFRKWSAYVEIWSTGRVLHMALRRGDAGSPGRGVDHALPLTHLLGLVKKVTA